MNKWAEKAAAIMDRYDVAVPNKPLSLQLAPIYATLALNETLEDVVDKLGDIAGELECIINVMEKLPKSEDIQAIELEVSVNADKMLARLNMYKR